MSTDPRTLAEQAELGVPPASGPGEQLAGYGVMGLPFQSGHYLALRRFPTNPFGRPYTAVWHRDPEGAWVFYIDTPPEASCPRYFDTAIKESHMADISITWEGPSRLLVDVPGALTWSIDLCRTPGTSLMTGGGRLLPGPMWNNNAVLAAMGVVAEPVLRVGHIKLRGSTPNGQWFKANPRKLWEIAKTSVVLNGTDLGSPGPLAEQVRIGDFWLPQRGMFIIGGGSFEAFDSARHHAPRPAIAPSFTTQLTNQATTQLTNH